jgi:hypothetical protein
LSEPAKKRPTAGRFEATLRWIAIAGVIAWVLAAVVAGLLRSLPGYPSYRELNSFAGIVARNGKLPRELLWFARVLAAGTLARSVASGAVGIAVALRLGAAARMYGVRLRDFAHG